MIPLTILFWFTLKVKYIKKTLSPTTDLHKNASL